MVTATIAEATRYGVTIKGTDGRTLQVLRGSLADSGDRHGVNRDEADELVERAGFVAGVWRWQESGSYYKAVVAPARRYEPWKPKNPEEARRLSGK